MYCCPTPIASVISSGVTEIEVMLGAVTVTDVDPVTEPSVAVIVAEPAFTPFTRPAASTVAFAIVEELHVTRSVMSQVLASGFVPVATICCVVFTGTVGFAGVTAMDAGLAHKFAVVTVICVEAENTPDRAVTAVTPVAPPVTTPAVETDAVVLSAELHVTEAVKSLLEPSEKLPMACNVCVLVTITVAAGGVTVSPVNDAEPPVPPPPPPPLVFFTPLHPAASIAIKRKLILRRTVFSFCANRSSRSRSGRPSLVLKAKLAAVRPNFFCGSEPARTRLVGKPIRNEWRNGSRFPLV